MSGRSERQWKWSVAVFLSVSSEGFLRHGGRKGPDAFSGSTSDHRSAGPADHPGEETGGGGARRPSNPGAPEKGVEV